jgi:FkbM family methyltransferase
LRFTVTGDDGVALDFECADTIASRWVCSEILRGRTYPVLPFVEDVSMVVDVGANCGAATVHLARHYPGATVHALEPASEPFSRLSRNVAPYPNVEIHAIGLHLSDGRMPLYTGREDSSTSSLLERDINLAQSELVEIRGAGNWAAGEGIDRIDVLKVDVEGSEVEVLKGFSSLLREVKVLYVEYDSRGARHEIEELMRGSHELYAGVVFLDQGECIYLRRDLADPDAANQHLRHLFTSGRTAQPRP